MPSPVAAKSVFLETWGSRALASWGRGKKEMHVVQNKYVHMFNKIVLLLKLKKKFNSQLSLYFLFSVDTTQPCFLPSLFQKG